MNIGTSRRSGPSISEKKGVFSGVRSVLPFIGTFFFVHLGMPWITCLNLRLVASTNLNLQGSFWLSPVLGRQPDLSFGLDLFFGKTLL